MIVISYVHMLLLKLLLLKLLLKFLKSSPLASILTGGSGSASSGSITPGALIPQLRALAKDKKVAAVVLRVDSPGGDALASDLMWREIRKLGEGDRASSLQETTSSCWERG